MNTRVLIGDGWNRVALSVLRELGRGGISPDVFEYKPRVRAHGIPPTFRSRWCRKSFVTVDGRRHSDEFLNELTKLLSGYDLYLPISTNAVYFASRHRDQLRKTGCAVPVVSPETLKTANDTYRLLSSIEHLDEVLVPETKKLTLKDASHKDYKEIGIPLVMKLQTDEGLELAPQERYCIVRSADEFRNGVEHFKQYVDSVLLQEYIPGDGYGFSTVVGQKGRILGAVSHHRIREYPPSGGPSALCESVSESDLLHQGRSILHHLNWYGPAQVEFRRHHETGQFYVLEVNPRFWGSLPLAGAAGINLTIRFVNHIMEHRTFPSYQARKDVKLRTLHLDVAASLSILRTNWNNLSTIKSIIRSWVDPTVFESVIPSDDPIPGILYIAAKLIP